MTSTLDDARLASLGLLDILDVSVPDDGLLKGKLMMAVGQKGARMCWTPQNSYEHAVINLLGCKLRDLRAALVSPPSEAGREEIQLQARLAEGGDWIDIYPAQLQWMAKEGHDVRALSPDQGTVAVSSAKRGTYCTPSGTDYCNAGGPIKRCPTCPVTSTTRESPNG